MFEQALSIVAMTFEDDNVVFEMFLDAETVSVVNSGTVPWFEV